MKVSHLHSHNCEGLKQKRQSRLATCQTCIQERDTRNNEPDQERHYNEVEIVKLKSLILSVDIFDIGIAAIGLRFIKLGL